MFRILLVFHFLLLSSMASGQALNPYAQKGDRMYRDSNYVGAEEAYRKANAENPSFNFQYNLANSLYQQGRIKEAQSAYEKSISNSSTTPQQLSSAYYNLGNTNFHNKAYDKSIEAYKESLKLNPKDAAAKINLAQAKRMKVQQQEQQQQNKQQEQKQQDQKDQNQQEQKNQQQNEKNADQKKIDNSQDDPKEKKEDQGGTEEKKLTKEEANQLLKMVEDKDKKVKERLQQQNRKRVPKDKDW
ncbi:MAG: tetratricopeptide repeat protein [Saprospiraceae bacterium]|jgi:Ca-activated chloride channel family protein|nr:tetratricopeptide repeat protein [Candidatus Defluviibacterium haderslevense]MCI1266097.1 tetratricopeptide repeat protein [Saprospiraceae bacterium]